MEELSLRQVFQAHSGPPRPEHVILTTYSLNPEKLQDMLTYADIPSDRVFCLFQRYSFRDLNAENELPYIGARRDEAIAGFNRLRRYKAFRVKGKRPVRQQLHMKIAIFVYRNNIKFVQFSRNLDRMTGNQEELVYQGLPQQFDRLIELLRQMLQEGDDYIDDMDNRRNALMAVLNQALQKYQQQRNRNTLDPNAFLVTQGFERSIAQEFKRLLTIVKEGNNNFYYKNWGRNLESVLLLHFPYINNGLKSNLCKAIVEPMSYDLPEKSKTHVELTYSSEESPFLVNFPHESWVCRMTGRHVDDRMLWFFLVSSNLTLPSWTPTPRVEYVDEDGNVVQPRPHHNVECGVVVFENGLNQPSKFTQVFRNNITSRMRPSDSTTLTTVECSLDRSEIPPDLVNVRMQDIRGQIPAAVNEDCCDDVLNIDMDVELTTWERFQRAQECLKFVILPGLVGTHNVVSSTLLKYNYFMRWALYDYIFNNLAKRHPVGRLGVYDEKTVKKYFLFELRGPNAAQEHPWIRSNNAHVTLNVLVDIFVRWSIAFDLYDPRLNAYRPEISARTVVTLHEGQRGEQIVEDARQKYRRDHSTYDTLTMLIQSMHSSAYLWWKCPKGHEFYQTPRNMMVRTSNCSVCIKYHDIRMLYEILQAMPGESIKFLTVEFPLMRRIVLDNPMEEVEIDQNEQAWDLDIARHRTLMRYDIFFLLDNTYVCAIEFDDASHNNQGQNVENILMNRPVADGIKNVLSSAMGIHLMRIWARTNRPNAKSRLELLVKTFLERVRANNTTVPDRDMDLFQRIERFQPAQNDDLPPGLPPTFVLTTLNGPLKYPDDLRDLLGRNLPSLPVSLVFATDVPHDSNVQRTTISLLREMYQGGLAHPCLRRGVQVLRQVDIQTVKGYHRMLVEWRFQPNNPNQYNGEIHYKLAANPSYRGRLVDGFELSYNGLVLVGNVVGGGGGARTIHGYYLESERIGPWKFVPQIIGNDVYQGQLRRMRAISKQYVRIKDPSRARPNGGGAAYPPNQDDDDAWVGITRIRQQLRTIADGLNQDPNAAEIRLYDREVRIERERWRNEVGNDGWWAWPPNAISFNHPRREDVRGAQNISRGFLRGTVQGVRKTPTRDGPFWYIEVIRDDDGQGDRFIREEDFGYVRPFGQPDHAPLSILMPVNVGRLRRRPQN